MVVQCFLHNSIRIGFTTESAGVREVKSLEQHMKCWSSPKGFDFGCHALRVRLGLRAFGPSPNVFVLALAFSPEWVPDVFFSWDEDLKHGDSEGPHAATKTTRIYTKNWHHLMSHTISSKRNYIHLNLSNTSPKETQKERLPSIYSQMQTAKTKVGHVQVIMDTLHSQWWEQHV